MIVMGSMIGSGIFITSAESCAIDRRAGLAVARLGDCRSTDHYRCALLLGTGHDDAARRRTFTFFCAKPTDRRFGFLVRLDTCFS